MGRRTIHKIFMSLQSSVLLFATTCILVLLPATAMSAEFVGETGLRAFNYAREDALSLRLDYDLGLHSEMLIPRSPLRQWDLELRGFVESSRQGDLSIDSGDVVYRHALGSAEAGHFWLGRVHPAREAHGQGLREGKEYRRIKEWTSVDALGSNWQQNQSNALKPDVKGWLGAGIHHDLGSLWSLTASYSPIFLPTFGPSLTLSENAAPSGSRFARLPPLYVEINEIMTPTRFRVDVGDLKDILFQSQAFVGISSVTRFADYQLMFWSAPSPVPTVDTSGQAIVDAKKDEFNVLIVADPRFERENFLGARFRLRQFRIQPEFQASYEMRSRRITFSAAIHAFHFLRAGLLHQIERDVPIDPDDPVVEEVHYADRLGWIELGPKFRLGELRPSLRWEHHFTPNREGSWVSPMVEFAPNERMHFYARADILTGVDFSYFGGWRSLDSVSLGGVWSW